MEDTGTIFLALEELEERIAKLYDWFSALFRDDPEIAALFASLSRDEFAHRDNIRNNFRPASKPSRGKSPDLEPIQNAIAAVKNINKSAPPSLPEALRITAILEIELSEYCFKRMNDGGPEFKPAMQSRGLSGTKRIALIQSLLEKRGLLTANLKTSHKAKKKSPGKKTTLLPSE